MKVNGVFTLGFPANKSGDRRMSMRGRSSMPQPWDLPTSKQSAIPSEIQPRPARGVTDRGYDDWFDQPGFSLVRRQYRVCKTRTK